MLSSKYYLFALLTLAALLTITIIPKNAQNAAELGCGFSQHFLDFLDTHRNSSLMKTTMNTNLIGMISGVESTEANLVIKIKLRNPLWFLFTATVMWVSAEEKLMDTKAGKPGFENWPLIYPVKATSKGSCILWLGVQQISKNLLSNITLNPTWLVFANSSKPSWSIQRAIK